MSAAAAVVEWTSPAAVPADHPSLPGHFPGRPVVPAVLLLELAAAAVGQRYPGLRLAAVGSAKFLHPVLPAQPLELDLAFAPDSGQARFRCRLAASATLAATGELRFVERHGR